MYRNGINYSLQGILQRNHLAMEIYFFGGCKIMTLISLIILGLLKWNISYWASCSHCVFWEIGTFCLKYQIYVVELLVVLVVFTYLFDASVVYISCCTPDVDNMWLLSFPVSVLLKVFKFYSSLSPLGPESSSQPVFFSPTSRVFYICIENNVQGL